MKNAIKPGTTASFNDWDVPGLNFAKTQLQPLFFKHIKLLPFWG